jgi:TRAP-type C4-dicarboxylate transport system permease small subunit
MELNKLVAIILIVGGALGLAYGGFTYTKETHQADIGPLTLSVDDNERINVPVWASIVAIVIGGLLFTRIKKI